jgi:hypothetical protein
VAEEAFQYRNDLFAQFFLPPSQEETVQRSAEENEAREVCSESAPAYTSEIGDAPDVSGTQEEFQRRVYDQVKADPQVLQALADWSECVAEEGYTADSPTELRSALTEWRGTFDPESPPTDPSQPQIDNETPPTEEEKAGAVASAACQRETGLWVTVYMAQVEAEAALIDEYRPVLQQARDHQLKEVAAAQEYIASVGE